MVLSGHIDGAILNTDGDTRFSNPVHQILTDFQREYETRSIGRGWLRVLTFHPDDHRIKSSIISTEGYEQLDIRSPEEYPLDPGAPQHAFEIDFDMSAPQSINRSDNIFNKFGDRIVNVHHQDDQMRPAVGMDMWGNAVVVWEDDGGDRHRLFARGFHQGGCERFYRAIDSSASGDQRDADVAMNLSGHFVVAWEDDIHSQSADGIEILARGLDMWVLESN
jgi:hypothetical protein